MLKGLGLLRPATSRSLTLLPKQRCAALPRLYDSGRWFRAHVARAYLYRLGPSCGSLRPSSVMRYLVALPPLESRVNAQGTRHNRGRYHNEQHARYTAPGRGDRVLWSAAASALIFASIKDDPGPTGKTRVDKRLELSQKQLDEEIRANQRAYGLVISWLLRNVWEPLLTLCRFAELLVLFLPLILTGAPLLTNLFPRSFKIRWYKYITWTLEMAGPSFIKLGQWAASRSDIFPRDLCEQLEKLHSQAREHHMAHTRKVVSDAFGKPFEECFAEFDPTPLGVGAMGQVYKARLVWDDYDGEVAVKVLHPHIETTIRRDLAIMAALAEIVNAIPTMEWLSFPGEVKTFGLMMQSQLDLRLEAENLNEFRDQFENDHDVSFPRPWLEVSTRQLLVEQLVDGVSMEKILKYCKQTQYDRKIAALGLDAFLKMLLLNNYIHSDLHAGNIFLTLDRHPKELARLQRASNQDEWDEVWDHLPGDAAPNIWFIDTGLVTELNPRNRANFVDLFKAIATFDGYRAGELIVERSRTPETAIDKDVFAMKTERLVNQVKKRTFALGSVGIGDLLTKMMEMVRDHHVRMESDFITVVLSILLLEGIGRRLDPDLDIFKSALPVLRKVSHLQTSGLPTDLSKDDTIQMLKVWLVLETRQFINASVQDIYNCVKYDKLSPNN